MLGSCCASLAICVPLAGRSRECLPIGIIGGGDFLQVRPDVAASFQRRGESLGHLLQRSTFGCYISNPVHATGNGRKKGVNLRVVLHHV